MEDKGCAIDAIASQSFCNRCISAAQSLRNHCANAVRTLCNAKTIQKLRKGRANAAHLLHNDYAKTKRNLDYHCAIAARTNANEAQRPRNRCIIDAQLLRKGCVITAQSLLTQSKECGTTQSSRNRCAIVLQSLRKRSARNRFRIDAQSRRILCAIDAPAQRLIDHRTFTARTLRRKSSLHNRCVIVLQSLRKRCANDAQRPSTHK
jgi:hypothetical protein